MLAQKKYSINLRQKYRNRQRINSLANSKSPLKRTNKASLSSVHFSGLKLLAVDLSPRRDKYIISSPFVSESYG